MQIQVTEWSRELRSEDADRPEYCAIHYRVLLTAEEVRHFHRLCPAAPLNDYLEVLEDNTYQLLAEQYELRHMGLWKLIERIEQVVQKAESDQSGCSAHSYGYRSPLTVT